MRKLLLVILLLPAVGARPAAQRVRGPAGLQLVEATIDELQAAMRDGTVTAQDIVRAYLARVALYDQDTPRLRSFLHVNAMALEEAKARDLDRAEGRAGGPLFGIPVLLKDNVDTRDMPTTAGSITLAGSIPPDDAFIARRLREAGAILLGKASMTEWANFMTNGMPGGYSSLGRNGLNPYDPRLVGGQAVLSPGGSSSGSGIAVSANLVTVAVGTETSGSILSPASANGVVGIKPTLGLVSRDGIVPITSQQDTAGPIARTVTDAAILLSALVGYDPNDPATDVCLVPGACYADYTRFLDGQALDGARIAVPHQPYWTFLTPDQRSLLRQAIAALREAGATVESPYEIPDQAALSQIGVCVTHPPPDGCSTVLLYGFKLELNAYLESRGPLAPVHELRDVIRANTAKRELALRYGQSILAAANLLDLRPGSPDSERYLADRARDLAVFRGALDALYAGPDGVPDTEDDFDASLFPASFGADAPARAGYPSIVVPGGLLDPIGAIQNPFPFGVTFSGPAFSEPRLIALAYAFEQATHHRTPPDSTPPLPGDRFP